MRTVVYIALIILALPLFLLIISTAVLFMPIIFVTESLHARVLKNE